MIIFLLMTAVFCEFSDTFLEEEKFKGELRVHFIDVGHGDAILIKAIKEDFKYVMLIDGDKD